MESIAAEDDSFSRDSSKARDLADPRDPIVTGDQLTPTDRVSNAMTTPATDSLSTRVSTDLSVASDLSPSHDRNEVSESIGETTQQEIIRAPWDDETSVDRDALQVLQNRLSAMPLTTEPSILRVNQLDADLLDDEIENILKSQMLPAFQLIKPSFTQDYLPELLALFRLAMFRFSVWPSSTTYGAQLQNLRYQNHRSFVKDPLSKKLHDMSTAQKIGYALCYIGVPWAWSRISLIATTQGWSSLPEDDWRKKYWRRMERVETIFKSLTLMNFIVFLHNGRYRNIIDRILGIRLVYIRPIMARNVSFDLMNRQLVFQGFFDFFFFLASLINFDKIKKSINGSINRLQGGSSTASIPGHVCMICNTDSMCMPHRTNCGHTFCYYCIQSHRLADSKFPCPRCGKIVASIERHLI
eukprot:TRINITY_DN966_c0_g1_i20.p1 TRINITY_DN966_c0_g1~~TRINITY_DN966_c0_g1_i20.p1  ORF type:complete len:412 (-),score=73.17 TRINITY_DN966_c0_g1_i20:226-1461(-)